MDIITFERFKEIVELDIHKKLDKSSLTEEESDLLDKYDDLEKDVNRLFNNRVPYGGSDISGYVEKAIMVFADIINSKINYWIDTTPSSGGQRESDKDSKGRFKLKYYTTPTPTTPYQSLNSEIFEKAIERENGFVGEGKEKRKGNHSSSYIIQPTNFIHDRGVIAISGRKDESLTNYDFAELLAVQHFNDILVRRSNSMYEKTTNKLTKVFNRKTSEDILRSIDDRTKKDNTPYTIMMLDIDHFKRINDDYGHDIGDKVLEKLGELVPHYLRKGDLIGRWGGEEFIISLVNVDSSQAIERAESLRKYLKKELTEYLKKLSIDTELSVSIGGYFSDPQKDTCAIEEKIKFADEALYASKRGTIHNKQQRDRVSFYYHGLKNHVLEDGHIDKRKCVKKKDLMIIPSEEACAILNCEGSKYYIAKETGPKGNELALKKIPQKNKT